jgi:hypothetical protein
MMDWHGPARGKSQKNENVQSGFYGKKNYDVGRPDHEPPLESEASFLSCSYFLGTTRLN